MLFVCVLGLSMAVSKGKERGGRRVWEGRMGKKVPWGIFGHTARKGEWFGAVLVSYSLPIFGDGKAYVYIICMDMYLYCSYVRNCVLYAHMGAYELLDRIYLMYLNNTYSRHTCYLDVLESIDLIKVYP